MHDLLPVEQPWSYSSRYRFAVRAQLEAFKRGKTEVVTVSERSRRRLVEALGRDVSLAPCGVRRPDPRDVGESGVADGFALFVGAHDPRKNVNFVLALRPILQKLGLRLVITTRVNSAAHASGSAAILRGLSDRLVTVIENPSDPRLWALYRDASLLLHPSVAEGFGLPLLEAAVMGTPSVSTPVGAAEEILADPALIAPAVEGVWREAITYCLEHQSRLRSDIGARAAAYSWKNTAASIAGVCARVAKR
jgi:glycosyltransferase involved in cell wall biosynthesis